ncbi:MAG: hypothetical protein RAO92_00715 [Candidatus Euphemobacter frigidus]|nr:hypothetical protein [Candidatus Euphemobacter frigidus]
MDLHHILDNLISQDAILDQMDSEELSYACTTGNIRPLWDIAPEFPLLQRGFTSGWINRFILEPFDPLCVMLAMRAKAMLDLVDEEGHSYNLIRKLGFGFIDFGEIPGEEPGDPGDYYPPEIDNPIDYPDIPTPPGPEPGEPGYVEPIPGDPGYVPPGPGDPGYVPGPGEPGYVAPGTTPGTYIGGGPGGGAPWGGGIGAGDLGGKVTPGGEVTPEAGDPCQSVDDPLETVSFSYTTQQMAVSETQDFAVTGMHPRWSYENYIWKVSGGGGTLDVLGSDPLRRIYGPEESEYDEDATIAGFAVQYTAPDVNPYCDLNPTIELWCGGNLMASLKIAITTARVGTAYRLVTKYLCTSSWGAARESRDSYNCLGAKIGSNSGACGGPGASWTNCANYVLPEVCCCVGDIYDVRTEEMKADGCCPVALL